MRRLKQKILSGDRRSLLAVGTGRIKCSGYEQICPRGVVISDAASPTGAIGAGSAQRPNRPALP